MCHVCRRRRGDRFVFAVHSRWARTGGGTTHSNAGQIKQSGPPATHRSVSARTNSGGQEGGKGRPLGRRASRARRRARRPPLAVRRHARLDIRTGPVKSARRCDLDGFDRFQESLRPRREDDGRTLVSHHDLLRAVVRIDRRGMVRSEMRAGPFDKATPDTPPLSRHAAMWNSKGECAFRYMIMQSRQN
ncbi:hypothetical protein MTO96_008906 [Rhipicephalus appendiculatus]